MLPNHAPAVESPERFKMLEECFPAGSTRLGPRRPDGAQRA